MALQLYNTITRSVEPFVPLDPEGRRVGLYCCGPTVYDFGHIGNFRTFVFADLVRRYLEFKGYAVTAVMNITDVEDKIIARVRTAGTTLREYTGRYETAFFEDARALNLLPPHHCPRATEHIGDIIALIDTLVRRGLAYQAADGSVYFSIEKYRAAGGRYGRLVNLNFDEMRIGERVKSDEYAKDAMADFALWKARTPEDGAVTWASPWGEGRPGWHIECSAMSMKILGPSFDLHLGGEDLAFPHHEDEIAQSEAANGCRFVNVWLHCAHLVVDGEKMSKSLGNFYTLRDVLQRGYSGREIRYVLLATHYRQALNFSFRACDDAKAALQRLDAFRARLEEAARLPEGEAQAAREAAAKAVGAFRTALEDDLNVSAALAALFDLVRDGNRLLDAGSVTASGATAILEALHGMDTVLAVMRPEEAEGVPEEILALAAERQAARKAKDFARADQIRDRLAADGWVIEDTPKGARVRRR